MKQTVNLAFALMGILFCVCLTIANILEVKIVSVGSLTMTGGLIVFPISYIINDCVAEVWGYRKARLLIWTGFAANFIAVAFIQLAIWLPPSPVSTRGFCLSFRTYSPYRFGQFYRFFGGIIYQCICDESHEAGLAGTSFFAACCCFYRVRRRGRFFAVFPFGFRRYSAA